MGCGCKNSSEENELIKNAVKGKFIATAFGKTLLIIFLSPILIPGTIFYLSRYLITGKNFNNKKFNDYLISKLNKEKDVEVY